MQQKQEGKRSEQLKQGPNGIGKSTGSEYL